MKKIIVIFVVLLSVFACQSKQPEFDKKNLLEKDETDLLFKKTESIKGKSIEITGKVFTEPEVDGDFIAIQMWHSPKNNSQNIIVYGVSNEEIKINDYVKVSGVVDGIFSGENSFGTKLEIPQINYAKIEKSTYKDVVAPTVDKYIVDKRITQHGVSIGVSEIEIANDETRLYVTVENNSKNKFNLYEYNAKIIIGSKQYSVESNFDANYEKIDNEIHSKINSKGILVFKQLENYEGKDIVFILEGSSDDYTQTFKPYKISSKLK